MNNITFIKRAIMLDIVLLIVVLDQLSKWYVTERVLRVSGFNETGLELMDWLTHAPERLSFAHIEITNFFNLVMVWNQGISFGLFSGNSDAGPIILLALSSIVSAILLMWLWRSQSWLQSSALALIIGGALGNIIDRFRFGAVIDFVDIHVTGYHWPAFNVADSCIVIGVLILLTYSLYFEKDQHA